MVNFLNLKKNFLLIISVKLSFKKTIQLFLKAEGATSFGQCAISSTTENNFQ